MGRVDHATRILLLNSPPMASEHGHDDINDNHKNDAYMSSVNMKCRSLIKRKVT